jgi:hypothetical protein
VEVEVVEEDMLSQAILTGGKEVVVAVKEEPSCLPGELALCSRRPQ